MSLRIEIEMNGEWIDITPKTHPWKITVDEGKTSRPMNVAPSGAVVPQSFTGVTKLGQKIGGELGEVIAEAGKDEDRQAEA